VQIAFVSFVVKLKNEFNRLIFYTFNVLLKSLNKFLAIGIEDHFKIKLS